MNAQAPPPKQPKTFEERVDQYVRLRDKINEMEEEHKKRVQPLKKALETLNGMMLSMLQQTGQDSAVTAAGTVYKKTRASAVIADGSEFRRHVIGSQDFDLLDWRANAPAVAKFIEDHGTTPPGVNFSTIIDVGVRRK